MWDVETWSAGRLIAVYPYCGKFDAIEFLFCSLRNLSGFISVDIGSIHTAKM